MRFPARERRSTSHAGHAVEAACGLADDSHVVDQFLFIFLHLTLLSTTTPPSTLLPVDFGLRPVVDDITYALLQDIYFSVIYPSPYSLLIPHDFQHEISSIRHCGSCCASVCSRSDTHSSRGLRRPDLPQRLDVQCRRPYRILRPVRHFRESAAKRLACRLQQRQYQRRLLLCHSWIYVKLFFERVFDIFELDRDHYIKFFFELDRNPVIGALSNQHWIVISKQRTHRFLQDHQRRAFWLSLVHET